MTIWFRVQGSNKSEHYVIYIYIYIYIFGMTYVLVTMLDQKFPRFLVGKPGKGLYGPVIREYTHCL